MDFQGDFDILLHPWVVGDNGSGGVILWLRIDVSDTLRLKLHDIEAGASLNYDKFSVVLWVD